MAAERTSSTYPYARGWPAWRQDTSFTPTRFALWLEDVSAAHHPPLTIADWAARTKLNYKTITGWLRGRCLPDRDHVAVVASAARTSESYVLHLVQESKRDARPVLLTAEEAQARAWDAFVGRLAREGEQALPDHLRAAVLAYLRGAAS